MTTRTPTRDMTIGVFDSGLGGLLSTKSIRAAMPDLDMIYFGDTLHLPYGNRSTAAIYDYALRGVEFLFAQGCNIIIIACNTVSAVVLRMLQQQYLPHSPYADRRILGVVVPTIEHAIDQEYSRLAMIATNYTIQSEVYPQEIAKIKPDISFHAVETPLLVPLIENNGEKWTHDVLSHYLEPLLENDIECLILGCTHYPILKDKIRSIIGDDIDIIAQNEILPAKLTDYLARHPALAQHIGREGKTAFYVSDLTPSYTRAAEHLYGAVLNIQPLHFDGGAYHINTGHIL